MYCSNCAKEMSELAPTCPGCGHPNISASAGSKSKVTAALLCFFLGALGAHRFYLGKPLTAILQILTFGGLGFWVIIDLVLIITGKMKDGQGKEVTQ